MERVLLVLMLVAPVALIALAVRMRRSREAKASGEAPAAPRPWDKSFRNGMLLALTGLLLLPSGLYAFSMLESRRWAPVFMLPVVAGVVLLSMGYRTWMRGVAQVPEE